MNKADFIYNNLLALFPEAKCQLDHQNNFQLLIAVILSAQTTDKAVNVVTHKLFDKYPSPYALANAELDDVEQCIKEIGLYKNKAKNIINCAKKIHYIYHDEVINNQEELMSLPGVGKKTSNVVLAECFNYPTIAVDTHVNRVSKRLKLADKLDTVEKVEEKLKEQFNQDKWIKLHHLMIFFGRYKCTSIKPKCDNCPFIDFCDKDNY